MSEKEYNDAVYNSMVLNGKLFTETWMIFHPKDKMVDQKL